MLISSYRNGSTLGTPPPIQHHVRAPRGEVKGWSAASVRRHTKWLYSVDAPGLDGQGFAITLTVRDCPASADEWARMRRAFIKRLEREGLVRVHWVTEWQRRGVPHLHAAVYFEDVAFTAPERIWSILRAWLDVAEHLGAAPASQDVKRIAGPMGWLQYLSKHASRGVKHYQRQGRPEGWTKAGRLWGYGGEWPRDEPMQFDVERSAGFRYRRLVRAWTVADARRSGDPKRIRWARQMLACSDPRLSSVRGVSGWVPEMVSVALVSLLIDQGAGVVQRVR